VSLDLVAAGLPAFVSESRDHRRIFDELAASGFTAFFPDIDHPEDFVAPWRSELPAVDAMQASGVRLVVPAETLYGGGFPTLADDPLARLVADAGREHVLAVTNFDEPAFGRPIDDVRRLYERVKEVDPTLPVMMVHPPLPRYLPNAPASDGPVVLPIPHEVYFERVLDYSRYADAIGFDVYPVPDAVLELFTTPFAAGQPAADHEVAVGDYVAWLAENAGKPYFMVLQGFTYQRNNELRDLYRLATSTMRAPNRDELTRMVEICVEGGCSTVVWWGQRLLMRSDEAVWEDVLAASRSVARS
jgi:hypothetical protein